MTDSTHGHSTPGPEGGPDTRPQVWLSVPPAEVGGLPDAFRYHFWDGTEDAYPADPADAVFYVVPYMKGPTAGARPLPLMRGVRVVQTLSAGFESTNFATSTAPSTAKHLAGKPASKARFVRVKSS